MFLTVCPLYSISAYNWQRHVPNWQQYVPNEQQQYIHNQNESTFSEEVIYGIFNKKNYQAYNLKVYGSLTLADSVIDQSLTVYGPALLQNTQVHGPLTLFGIMKTIDSSLNDIQAATTEISLINTTANNIVILKNSDNPTEQKIYLKKNTAITG